MRRLDALKRKMLQIHQSASVLGSRDGRHVSTWQLVDGSQIFDTCDSNTWNPDSHRDVNEALNAKSLLEQRLLFVSYSKKIVIPKLKRKHWVEDVYAVQNSVWKT